MCQINREAGGKEEAHGSIAHQAGDCARINGERSSWHECSSLCCETTDELKLAGISVFCSTILTPLVDHTAPSARFYLYPQARQPRKPHRKLILSSPRATRSGITSLPLL